MSELTFNTGAQLAKVKFDEEVDNMLLHLEQAFCRPVQQTMYNCMAECQINAPRGEVGNCMDACKEEMNVLKQGISDEIKKLLDYQRADFDACAQTAQNKSNPTVYFSDCVKHRLEIHGELLDEIVHNVAAVATGGKTS